MNEFTVLVTGWRYWPWPMRHYVWSDLRQIHDRLPGGWVLRVRHGHCATGVDAIADQYAVRHEGYRPHRVPARWLEHDDLCGSAATGGVALERWCPGPPGLRCMRAGDRRNAAMCAMEPVPGYALAYPGPEGQRSGTRNCMKHLRARGIPGFYRSFEDPGTPQSLLGGFIPPPPTPTSTDEEQPPCPA